MVDTTALANAVAAHGAWKQRLARAIETGTDVSTPEKVRVDNACDFGKWLYGADAATRASVHYAAARDLHAQFHRVAADVLTLALAGRKAEAAAAMASRSPFAVASANLTGTMMAWSRSLAA